MRQFIDVTGQIVDFALIEVARHAERTGRIAVKRTETERIFALVRGVEQDIPAFILQGHQHHRAQTRLDVLLRRVERRTANNGFHRIDDGLVSLRNRNHVVSDSQIVGQLARVDHRVVGRKLRRHQQRLDVSRPSASTARQATTAESIPPERPMAAFA